MDCISQSYKIEARLKLNVDFRLRKLLVEFVTFFGKLMSVQYDYFEDVQQRIDFSLSRIELIDNHYFLLFKQAVAGFKAHQLQTERGRWKEVTETPGCSGRSQRVSCQRTS